MRKPAVILLLAALAQPAVAAAASGPNPLSKVVELLSGLEAKIIKEGELEVKAFKEYTEWCDDESKTRQFEIKTATTKKEKLEAIIAETSACIESSSVSIEELAASISTSEEDLKNATLIREKENANFLSGEAELVSAVDTLERAVTILDREMAKNPALVQAKVDTTSLERLVKTMGAVIDAAALPGSDGKKLLALVQARHTSKEEEEDADLDRADADEVALGAPAAATYTTHSASIVEVLEEMKEKAEVELADLRKAENSAKHNYDMLKQSIEDQMKADKKDMEETKANKASCEEEKATAEGSLATTLKDLANAQEALAFAQQSCMTVAADHEQSVKDRNAELVALAEAKKVLEDTSAGAVSQTYSLLQTSSSSRMKMKTRSDLAGAEIVNIIKKLAKQHHSVGLAQLASRITAVMRYGTEGGDDPFAKVKGLIVQMIDKLMKEANAEAEEKAYCDDEMAKTEEKKGELEDDVAKLTAKIDKAAAASAELKADVKELQEEIAALLKQQAEMDKIRQDEAADFAIAKADLQLGVDGVQKALSVLREYYGGESALLQDGSQIGTLMEQPAVPVYHKKAEGAGGGIISILEVAEADFSNDLAQRTTAEEDEQAIYDKMTQENKVTKAMKDQDVKYKTQAFLALEKEIASWSTDLGTFKTELSAVLEYYDKLKDRCIAKPETYEERKRRREAEIAGLKEALEILEGETAFVQKGGQGLLRR